MSDCTGFRELLGGHVLEALDPAEEQELRRHLETCPRCRREHAELAGVPAMLDMLDSPEAGEAAPPAELEEAILDRFARERRKPAPLRLPGRGSWGLRLGLAGALAAAVAALALVGVLSGSDGDSAYGHVSLRGSGPAEAYAKLRKVSEGTGVDLSVHGLPARQGGLYEVWCVGDDGRWISGGTFRVDGEGQARVSLTSAARPGEYKLMLVTKPTRRERGQRVLAGRVEY